MDFSNIYLAKGHRYILIRITLLVEVVENSRFHSLIRPKRNPYFTSILLYADLKINFQLKLGQRKLQFLKNTCVVSIQMYLLIICVY